MKEINISRTVGREYGHVPGNNYNDVQVTVSRSKNGRWRVEVLETWGSDQGYEEEHGRNEVYACSQSLESAGKDAGNAGRTAGITEKYLVQALTKAIHAADEAAEEDDSNLMEDIPTSDLEAELARRQSATR
ncbi:MAG: hypothetical protein ABSF38_01280 [Verrucomicrobiota bacterium]|jgi:hypothetical protein